MKRVLFEISMCSVCNADLRYLNEIHRIDMKWYCDKCYKEYKVNTLKEIFINQSKDFTKIVDNLNYDQRKYLIGLLQNGR